MYQGAAPELRLHLQTLHRPGKPTDVDQIEALDGRFRPESA